jgi:hypothetical protein
VFLSRFKPNISPISSILVDIKEYIEMNKKDDRVCMEDVVTGYQWGRADLSARGNSAGMLE